MPDKRLGIDSVGAGFVARFHLQWRRAAPIAGRPSLGRAAEEHSGPHMPWFWSGQRQGGRVLNDMLCHSYEAARFLLTAPEEPRAALTVRAVSAQIASLKWTRPEDGELLQEMMGRAVDYHAAPAEDFARATVTLTAPDDRPVIVEATISWSFVGPGLRLRMELLGPEYSMQVGSLHADLSVFLSRRVVGAPCRSALPERARDVPPGDNVAHTVPRGRRSGCARANAVCEGGF